MIPSPLLVVTDRHGADRPLVETIQRVLDGGARWIWFRDKDLEPNARRDLALECLALVQEAGGTLTIGGDASLAAKIGADGVHLSGREQPVTGCPDDRIDWVRWTGRRTARTPISSASLRAEGEAIQGRIRDVGEAALDCFAALAMTDLEACDSSQGRITSPPEAFAALRHLATGERWVEFPLLGFSAHSLSDIRAAASSGADYATLSPIFSTASKPGYGPALGLDALREAAAIGLPVIALGGIGPDEARACRHAGAAGVAVMGGLMRAADPAAETRRFLQALRPAT